MTEWDVKNKIEDAIKALEEYQRNLNENKGIWYDDIKKSLPLLIEKSHAIGAAGKPCPCCKGSGRA